MRNIININENWKFIQKNVGLPSAYPQDWDTVDLPHTWNAVDGNDGNGSYDRGNYWYAKTFETPEQPLAGGRVFVEFEGVNSEATVYVNGTKVTYHEGGYSIFRADITDFCKEEGENLLLLYLLFSVCFFHLNDCRFLHWNTAIFVVTKFNNNIRL